MILPDSKTQIVERGNKKVYDLGDKIVKVANAAKPVSDVFNEALNLARINEAGIRSPKVLEVSEVEGDGWAVMTEKVPGVTLAEKMAEDPSRFYEYLEQFVDLQIEIHGFRAPLLNRQRDKYARMINSLAQINATTRYNLLERLDGMKKEFQVCHGDFNPTNVIVGDDGNLYVCDWAHATQGSPAADAAMTYLLLRSRTSSRQRPISSSTAIAPMCPCRLFVAGCPSSLPPSLLAAALTRMPTSC